MDVFGAMLLLGMGFAVGLSGALMPGPLFVYTIRESLERGKWTGALVISGHALVEVLIFAFLMLGASEVITSSLFVRLVSILGGIAMILMGASAIRNIQTEVKLKKEVLRYNPIIGGIIYTAFNPGFPIWWATAGMRLLLEGMHRMGFAGMLLVFIGHWGADWSWFTFVSMTTARTSGLIFRKGWYKVVRTVLSFALLAIGAYFLATGM
jgi:threonine/homoserine/homoserine lactone efflux protein